MKSRNKSILRGLVIGFATFSLADLSLSLLVLAGWLLGLLLVATLIFQRQDITS